MNKKKIGVIILVVFIILLLVLGGIFLIDFNRMKNGEPVLFSTWGKKYAPEEKSKPNSDLKIVLSLEDEIEDNTAWCGTFNLIWNDLKNDLAKQDIVFTPQLKTVENLNKGTFNTSHLSEDSYYKVYGHPSLELKKLIEKAIKDKFNQTSDILDDFDWGNRDSLDYFLYSMLYKKFEFPKVFTEMEKGKFDNTYENVEYFGCNHTTDDSVRKQITVLYHNSDDDFAIKLTTKTNDEVILVKGLEENTFGKLYAKVQERTSKYGYTTADSKEIDKMEEVKIPNINFNLKERITELEEKSFKFSNGVEYSIEQAMQTIQFELDKKGGKIKSEAGIMLKNESIALDDRIKPRQFYIDDTFTIFLKEKDSNLPYFAAKISDISKVQSGVTKISSNNSENIGRLVMVNGKIYKEARESEFKPTCGTMDDYITSNVAENEMPTKDNESNFKGTYGYQYVGEDSIIVLIDNKWISFVAE